MSQLVVYPRDVLATFRSDVPKAEEYRVCSQFRTPPRNCYKSIKAGKDPVKAMYGAVEATLFNDLFFVDCSVTSRQLLIDQRLGFLGGWTMPISWQSSWFLIATQTYLGGQGEGFGVLRLVVRTAPFYLSISLYLSIYLSLSLYIYIYTHV